MGNKLSATATKKAEDLIIAKFRVLREALECSVKSREDELHAEWASRSEIKSLRKQAEKLDAARSKLRKKREEIDAEIEKINRQRQSLQAEVSGYTGNSNYAEDQTKAAPLLDAIAQVRRAWRQIAIDLRAQEAEAVKNLWFKTLDAEAIKLLDGIPTIDNLKHEGFAVLNAPATKILNLPGKKRTKK